MFRKSIRSSDRSPNIAQTRKRNLKYAAIWYANVNRIESTGRYDETLQKANLDFFELNMNLPQFQIECLDAFYATGTKSLFV